MKKFLQLSGLISLAAAAVAFILVLITHGVVKVGSEAGNWYGTPAVLFGNGNAHAEGSVPILGTLTGYYSFNGQGSSSALASWIFSLIAILGLLAGAILPFLKVKGFDKFAGLVNLCSVVLLLTAGILLFFTVTNFFNVNGSTDTDGWALGGGWVIAAILYIAAGAIAICPAVADFVSKKK
ncbi:MAG: hypothetical protein K5925_05655 [Bacilli bacterium]|nr:hypothetical protein [Bacilli bacterium]